MCRQWSRGRKNLHFLLLQQQTTTMLATVVFVGGSLECWWRWGACHPLAPFVSWPSVAGFITVGSVCERRGGAALLGWRELGGGGLHSVTSQPSTPQSHTEPGQGRPGHRRLQTLSHTAREIYSRADPTQMAHFLNTYSSLLLILLRNRRVQKVINDNAEGQI